MNASFFISNCLLDIEPLPLALIESMNGGSLIIKCLLEVLFEKENTSQQEQKLAGTIKRLISRSCSELSPTEKMEICQLINQTDFSQLANPPLILNSLFHSNSRETRSFKRLEKRAHELAV